jgi:uncharacterized membrane protein required for colicin V production
MVLALVATLLILGIAFFQVVQGLFSALIMAILTVLSVAIAFNYYEPLAAAVAAYQPATAHAIALITLFVIPLLVLRLIFDRLIQGNVVFGPWADRVGGGAFGLITGILCVGVLAIALQMLPWGASVLTYRPYDDYLRPSGSLAPFYPDRFTIAVAGFLSGGSLSGERRFDELHDDLVLELLCARNTAGVRGRIDAPPDSLTVRGLYRADTVTIDEEDRTEDISPHYDYEFVVVRVGVSEEARDGGDDWFRLPATHFHLVTDAGRGYYPIGYLTYWQIGSRDLDDLSNYGEYKRRFRSGQWRMITPLDRNDEGDFKTAAVVVQRKWWKQGGPEELNVDWVYNVPRAEKPRHVVFRRVVKVDLPRQNQGRMPPDEGALARFIERRR